MLLSGPIAQWIRHRLSERGIAGSSPAGVIVYSAAAPVSQRSKPCTGVPDTLGRWNRTCACSMPHDMPHEFRPRPRTSLSHSGRYGIRMVAQRFRATPGFCSVIALVRPLGLWQRGANVRASAHGGNKAIGLGMSFAHTSIRSGPRSLRDTHKLVWPNG